MLQQRAGKMAPWVKCLVCKDKDRVPSVERMYNKDRHEQCHVLIIPGLRRPRQAHPGGSTASQPHTLGNFQASEKRVSRANVDDT